MTGRKTPICSTLERVMLTANVISEALTPFVAEENVLVVWIMTKFLCYVSSKMFLQLAELTLLTTESNEKENGIHVGRFVVALSLSAIQCLFCLLLLQSAKSCKKLAKAKETIFMIASHALSLVATNLSMAYIQVSSTLAIQLTEPVIKVIARHMIYQTSVPLQTIVSIPFIICGILVFLSQIFYDINNQVGLYLALSSIIIISAHKLTTMKLDNTNSKRNFGLAQKWYANVIIAILYQIAFVGILFYLEKQNTIPRNYSLLVGLSLASGIFHVTHVHLSASNGLNIQNGYRFLLSQNTSRVVMVALLYVVEIKSFSVSRILGLCVAACGLIFYSYGKTYSDVDLTRKCENNAGCHRSCGERSLFTLIFFIILSVSSVITIRCLVQQHLPQTLPDVPDFNIYRESHGLHAPEIPSTDFSHILEAETDPDMREFLSWRLVDHPEDTDRRSKTLTSNIDVVEEAQRILVNLLQDLLGKAKHVMLIEIATYENKGDPAISVGEIMLLRRMNISIVYYCSTYVCEKNASVVQALKINKKYSKDELVLLLQGGGNLVGYALQDNIRKSFIDNFPDRKIILLSQSIWLNTKNTEHLVFCRSLYSNHSNLIMFLRDRQSFEIARTNFPGVTLVLAPDMAFGIGMVPRQLPPLYDIVWLQRSDDESSRYQLPIAPANISMHVSDWITFTSNKAQTDMDDSFLVTTTGFHFLQRGRVVVTDRLHGHILSTLMNIPHVLIDNPPFLKLSAFDRVWTNSLSNKVLVSNGTEALDAAIQLLKHFNNVLPSVGTIHKNVASDLL